MSPHPADTAASRAECDLDPAVPIDAATIALWDYYVPGDDLSGYVVAIRNDTRRAAQAVINAYRQAEAGER